MASSTNIRLSPDVETIAQEICKRKGLGSIRQAIEAVVRVYGSSYLGGELPPCTKPAPYSAPIPVDAPIDGNTAMAELGF